MVVGGLIVSSLILRTEEKGEGEENVANGPAEPKTMTLEEWKATQV